MKTIALITLLLACKQPTSVPLRSFETKFYFSVGQDGQAVVIYPNGTKVPSTLHDLKIQADIEPLTTIKSSGNNISIDRLLRWQRALISFAYKMGNTDISSTCVVRWDKDANPTGQSWHENRLIEDCSDDSTLNVFARFCRAEKGKFIFGEDVAPNNVYAKTSIELPDNSFACVFARKGKEIVVPSYCFVDAYQDEDETMSAIFPPDNVGIGFNVPADTIDTFILGNMLRDIDPAGVATPKIPHYSCRHKKSSGSDGVGYHFLKNGRGPALTGLPEGGAAKTRTNQQQPAVAQVPQDYQELTLSMDTTPLTDVALQFDCPTCRTANKHITIHVLNTSNTATLNNAATANNKIADLTASQSTKVIAMRDLLFAPLPFNRFCLGLLNDAPLHELFRRCNNQLAFAIVDNAQTDVVHKHFISTSYERTLPKACFAVGNSQIVETAGCRGGNHSLTLTWLKKRAN